MKYNPIKYWWYRTTNKSLTRLCEFMGYAIVFTLVDYALVETAAFHESYIMGVKFAVFTAVFFSTLRTVLSIIVCLLAAYDKRPYAGWVKRYNDEVRGR